MVVLYLDHLNAPNSALPLLRRLVVDYEGTSHAANAMHQIRQLETNFELPHGTLNQEGAFIEGSQEAAPDASAIQGSSSADAEPEAQEDPKA